MDIRVGKNGTKNHLLWLDWLRFLAALMVVAIHARGGFWVEWARLDDGSRNFLTAVFFASTRAGTEWVLVFFVLSGFLVGGNAIEKVQRNTFRLSTFAIDRITRIWLPLIPALAFTAFVAHLIGLEFTKTALLFNLLGLQGVFSRSFGGNYPLWSLAYEIWFYILAGCLAAWWTLPGGNRIISGLGIAASFMVFTVLDSIFLFAWIMGALTFRLRKELTESYASMLALGLVVLGYVGTQMQSATVSLDTSIWLSYAPPSDVSMIVLATGIAFALPSIVQWKPTSSALLSFESLGRNLAASSYTLYLVHYPTLYLWQYFFPGRRDEITLFSTSIYLAQILSCMVLAWILYLPFERNTTQIRSALLGRLDRIITGKN